MFSSNQSSQNNKKPRRNAVLKDSVTILTASCHFNGKLYCRGSSRIGGRIEGQIISEGELIIEEQAYIAAEISADVAIIQGRVKGHLKAASRVELSSTSSFEGDIDAPVLVISEGASFNGRATMPQNEMMEEAEANPHFVEDSSEVPPAKYPKMENGGEVAVLKVPEVNVPS